MSFGDVLRSLRKQHHMTQSDLARVLGVAESAVSMWELGRRRPDHEMMEQIADYFNVDMNYLFGKSDVPNAFRFAIKAPNGEVVAWVGNKAAADKKAAEANRRQALRFALWGEVEDMTDADVEEVLRYADYVRSKGSKDNK